MNSNLNIVILAAGAGTRMKSALPKVLHKLAGKSMLSHVIETAKELLPSKMCVVIGHGGEHVKETIGDDEIIWVTQEEQKGTGHAVLQALPHLDETGSTLILYGDVPMIRTETLREIVQNGTGNHCVLLTTELADPHGYGRIIRNAENGGIESIVEQKDADETQRAIKEINTGIMLIPNQNLRHWLPNLKDNNKQEEYYLTDVIKMAVDGGIPVIASHPENNWEVYGVNSRGQLAELERIYQIEYANRLLADGVTLIDPSRIDIRGHLNCGIDVEIDVNCVFEGKVELGDGVKVKANCVLKDVTVLDGTVIEPFSYIVDSEIGKHCKIGPYARIRPETKLSDKVHIGNFVEVKKSSIATGSKVNHLSYIGDTEMGQNVNIGAGTITCNYDGAYKHKTVIEDNVFVGSDTQLVAPVKVSYGSTIGAGSTITKETPANELTLSRSKQVTLSGWKRPTKNK